MPTVSILQPILLLILFAIGAVTCLGADGEQSGPVELNVLNALAGNWDAEIEVWPAGPSAPSIKFKGRESNSLLGHHWISSDFESDYNGETTKVHSIVGYDLDKKKMVGTIIDQGPYAASLSGDYDADTKTVNWTTTGKEPTGKPFVQKTSVQQKGPDERALLMRVPGKKDGEFNKFMEIRYTRRK